MSYKVNDAKKKVLALLKKLREKEVFQPYRAFLGKSSKRFRATIGGGPQHDKSV